MALFREALRNIRDPRNIAPAFIMVTAWHYDLRAPLQRCQYPLLVLYGAVTWDDPQEQNSM